MLSDIMYNTTRNMVRGLGTNNVSADTCKRMIKTPQDINKGFCGDWAEQVYNDAYDAGIAVDIVHDSDLYDMDYCHTFIYYEGKYYDSETLNGIDDWTLLPIYDRLEPVDW